MSKLLSTISMVNSMQISGKVMESIPYYDEVLSTINDRYDWKHLYVSIWKELALAKCGDADSIKKLEEYKKEAEYSGYKYISNMADSLRLVALYHQDEDRFREQLSKDTFEREEREIKDIKNYILDYRNGDLPEEPSIPEPIVMFAEEDPVLTELMFEEEPVVTEKKTMNKINVMDYLSEVEKSYSDEPIINTDSEKLESVSEESAITESESIIEEPIIDDLEMAFAELGPNFGELIADEPIIQQEEPIAQYSEPAVQQEEPIVQYAEPTVQYDEPVVQYDEPINAEPIVQQEESVNMSEMKMAEFIGSMDKKNASKEKKQKDMEHIISVIRELSAENPAIPMERKQNNPYMYC